MNCPKCDEPVNRLSKFCVHCGLPLSDDATVIGLPTPALTPDQSHRRWPLYAAIGAGCLVALVGALSAALSGSSKGSSATAPRPLRANAAQPGLYGSAPARGTTMASALRGEILTSPVPATSRPLTPDTPIFRAPAPRADDPAHMQQAPLPEPPRFVARPDPFPPPVMLYNPRYLDERPPVARRERPVFGSPFFVQPPVFGSPAAAPPPPVATPPPIDDFAVPGTPATAAEGAPSNDSGRARDGGPDDIFRAPTSPGGRAPRPRSRPGR